MQSRCGMLSMAASSKLTTNGRKKRSVKCSVQCFKISPGVMNVIEPSFDFKGTRDDDLGPKA